MDRAGGTLAEARTAAEVSAVPCEDATVCQLTRPSSSFGPCTPVVTDDCPSTHIALPSYSRFGVWGLS